jgi:hypothetical protein
VLEARWPEFDLGGRDGAGGTHLVLLSDRAAAILNKLGEAGMGNFVFEGQKPDKPPFQHGNGYDPTPHES